MCRRPPWRRPRCSAEIVERVAKETNGGFQIKYHLGGSLTIKVTDITTAVGDDVIQIGDDGFQQGNVPITGILRLPMLITNAQEFEKALAVMKPYVDKAYDKKGVDRARDLLLPDADRLVEQEAHLARRLQGPEDPRHLARADRVLEALRRQRTHRRRPEVPSALERGVVDGVLTANAGGGKVWKDLLKYCYEIGLNFFEANIVGEQGGLRQAAGGLSRNPDQGDRRALAEDDAR